MKMDARINSGMRAPLYPQLAAQVCSSRVINSPFPFVSSPPVTRPKANLAGRVEFRRRHYHARRKVYRVLSEDR